MELFFREPPTCRIDKGSGRGESVPWTQTRLTLTGRGSLSAHQGRTVNKGWMTGVRRVEDRAMGIAFGADFRGGMLREGS